MDQPKHNACLIREAVDPAQVEGKVVEDSYEKIRLFFLDGRMDCLQRETIGRCITGPEIQHESRKHGSDRKLGDRVRSRQGCDLRAEGVDKGGDEEGALMFGKEEDQVR